MYYNPLQIYQLACIVDKLMVQKSYVVMYHNLIVIIRKKKKILIQI